MNLEKIVLEARMAGLNFTEKDFWKRLSLATRSADPEKLGKSCRRALVKAGYSGGLAGLKQYAMDEKAGKVKSDSAGAPGAAEKPEHFKEETTFGKDGEPAGIDYEGTAKMTVASLIAKHEIDTTKYDVAPVSATSWNGFLKMADGTPRSVTLHRLKISITPKPKQEFLMAEALDWIMTRPAYVPQKSKGNGKTGILMVSDIHFGASIEGFLLTKTFNSSTLAEDIGRIVERTNELNFSKVHVVIAGDLIESFTGVSHPSTWKGMDKTQVGANAVKGVATLLHEHLLSKVRNLGETYVVGGNHGRGTVKMDGDTDAWSEDMACEMLRLRGYKVNFDPILLNPEIDGIRYLISHGHFGITKKTTPDLVNKYGSRELFNILVSGHVHNGKKSQGYSVLKERVQEVDLLLVEAHNHLKITLRPMFSGGRYELENSWHSQSGGMIVWNSGNGKPSMLDIIL
jgi:predicted phosphodiesterase